jgi:hypothetical protein
MIGLPSTGLVGMTGVAAETHRQAFDEGDLKAADG